MSDWTATYSTVGVANNGLDLEMSWGQFLNPERDPVSSETTLAVAREAVVLLKNDDDMLPFSRKIRNVVMMGPNATNIPTGRGCGFVMPFETVSVAEGIRDADKRLRTKTLTPELTADLTSRGRFFTPDGKPGLRGEFFANPRLEGKAAATVDAAAIDFFWQSAPVEGVPATQFSARSRKLLLFTI